MLNGAFGAHGLKNRATPDQIHAWETASSYAIINGLGLLALSLHPRFSVHRFAGPAIAGGGILFSGTIWGLVWKREYKVLGPLTPLGASLMIMGYISLAF